jgi:translation initiation factor IF-2
LSIRIHQLAKELGIQSKVLIARCQEQGYAVTNHMGSLDDEAAAKMRSVLAAPKAKPEKKTPAKRKPKKVSPPKPEPKTKAAPEAEKITEKAPPAPKHTVPPPTKAPPRETAPLEARKPAVIAEAALETQPIVRQRITPRTTRRGRPRFRRKAGRRVPRRAGPLNTDIEVSLPVAVKTLSSEAGLKASDILRVLVSHGIMVSITEPVPEEALKIISTECGINIKVKETLDLEQELLESVASQPGGDLKLRAPVVTLLGHVDHGKTSLLDSIRSSDITSSESGGITQHIGAYKVKADGNEVVLLDTPGHEAFTAMRARGANVTDLVVLVVAADDGVMAQTDEAIAHAKAAGVPIVVAVNKIDRPDANPTRVKQQLAERGLMVEEWGGKTVFVETSAVTKQGVDDLLEMLALEAELLELKGDPTRPGTGTVLEARLSGGRGVVANALVQDGTLRKGDIVLCGKGCGKIRALYDAQGKAIREAGPSTPVEITGLSALPEAGDKFYVVGDMQKAKAIAAQRERRGHETLMARRKHVSLESVFATLKEGEIQELRAIIKADVQGSVEVLREATQKLSGTEVAVNILYAAVGGITESDVLLADASDAIIIGFHVVPNARASRAADERGVEVRLYQVIYDVTNDIRAALEGMLAPEQIEVLEGRLTVKQIFKVSRIGTIAGCYVEEGSINQNSKVRVVREGIIIYDGLLQSLRRFKDDIRDVSQGYECGVKVAKFDDIKEGDELISYRINIVARKLGDQASK